MSSAQILRSQSAVASSVVSNRTVCKPVPIVACRPSSSRLVSNRRAAAVKAQNDEKASGGKKQEDEELPPWARKEKEKQLQAGAGSSLPWPVFLLASTLVGIAAIGSVSEFYYRHPVFGVIQPDNPAWAPILLGLAITGIPFSGFLFLQGVNGFNEASDLQNRLDGYND